MQILNNSSAWLSNFEVYDHLQKQKDKREALAATLKYPPRTAVNVLTIEFEALKYLSNGDAAKLDEQKLGEILEYLLQFKLTKAEKLQIVNNLPRSPVDFYLIVEECDERFNTEEIEQILENIQRIAGVVITEEE